MPDKLDLRLTQALESHPDVRVPDDFATRTLARVPRSQRSHRFGWAEAVQHPAPRIALWTTRAASALLILAMFLFAPWALTRSTAAVTLEFLLTAEFVALTVWTSLRSQRS